MAIKIPQDIRDALDSNTGHQPVAFVDIYEERGDFQVIDTQSQLKAINDPAVANDVNVDFDRKPGFAVLAPGKRVDSTTTAIQKAWGSVPVDLSAIAPAVDFTVFEMHGLFSIGNSVIVGFASYRTVSMLNGKHRGAQLTSIDGGLSYSVNDLGLLDTTNLIFKMKCEITDSNILDYSAGTFFDKLVVVDVYDNVYEYSSGNSIPTITAGATFLRAANVYSLINNIYITQRNAQLWVSLDKNFITGNSIYGAYINEFSVLVAFGTPKGVFTIGNEIFVFFTNGIIVKSQIPTLTTGFNFVFASNPPAGATGDIYYREVNSTIIAFSTSTKTNTTYHYSTDFGLTWNLNQITTINVTLKSYQNTLKSPVYSVVLSNETGANALIDVIYTTTDGINWTEFFDKSQYDFNAIPASLNSTGPGITYTKEGNLTLVRYDDSYSDNASPQNSPTGFPITDEFEYDVSVSDIYVIDTGAGKK